MFGAVFGNSNLFAHYTIIAVGYLQAIGLSLVSKYHSFGFVRGFQKVAFKWASGNKIIATASIAVRL